MHNVEAGGGRIYFWTVVLSPSASARRTQLHGWETNWAVEWSKGITKRLYCLNFVDILRYGQHHNSQYFAFSEHLCTVYTNIVRFWCHNIAVHFHSLASTQVNQKALSNIMWLNTILSQAPVQSTICWISDTKSGLGIGWMDLISPGGVM